MLLSCEEYFSLFEYFPLLAKYAGLFTQTFILAQNISIMC